MFKEFSWNVLFVLLLFNARLYAQVKVSDVNHPDYKFLKYSSQVPEDLLSTRSAVLISTSFEDERSNVKKDWKVLSEEGHNVFYRLGVDAVAYYNFDDFFANESASASFSSLLKKRNIKNLILILERKRDSGENYYEIIVTTFNGKPDLIGYGQDAFKILNSNYSDALRYFFNEVYRAELKRSNHLVIDVPEYFSGVSFIPRNRFEEYPSDLRVDKLAIRLFDTLDLSKINGDEEEIKRAEKLNQVLRESNEELKEAFKNYPREYGFIPATFTSRDAWETGYTYVLNRIYTSGESIKLLLGYDLNPAETGYISSIDDGSGELGLKTIPSNALVHKYYIQHANNKDIFIGERWDSDYTWENALRNFLATLRKEVDLEK